MKHLFEHYPTLVNQLPLFPIGSFPTPVEPLDSIHHGLWVKRDDLSAPEYGGNKVRKLEAILGNIPAGKKHIVTLGGIGTNHGLAVAFYARRLNLPCTLILFHQPVTPSVRRKLRLFHSLGADIRYYPAIQRALLDFFILSRIRHPNAFFIKGGGSSPLGTIGYVNAAFELAHQIENNVFPAPDVVFCPFGSGGTLAGLALGLQLCNLKTRLVGIQVTPFPAINQGTVARLMRGTYSYLKHRCPELPDITPTPPEIDIRYLGEGYGFVTQAGQDAMNVAHQHSNIVLDETYTAKTFAAVLDYCRDHTGDNVLYWHTLSAGNLSAYEGPSSPSGLPPAVKKLITD